MILRTALNQARRALKACETADLDAQALLSHSLGVDRAFLFTHAQSALSDSQAAAFQSAVARRAGGEPIAYITGAQRLL